jgi:hypothetical protein
LHRELSGLNVLDLATGGRHNGKEGIKKLENLFHDTLKDIYFAEKKILATLPKMEKAAQSAELKGNSLWVLFNHSGQNDYFAAPRQPKVRAVSTVTLGKVY